MTCHVPDDDDDDVDGGDLVDWGGAVLGLSGLQLIVW